MSVITNEEMVDMNFLWFIEAIKKHALAIFFSFQNFSTTSIKMSYCIFYTLPARRFRALASLKAYKTLLHVICETHMAPTPSSNVFRLDEDTSVFNEFHNK